MREPVIRVTMPDGSEWEVPAKKVAEDKAEWYAKLHGYFHLDIYNDLLEDTLKDDAELLDWAANNMNWADVSLSARRVLPQELSYGTLNNGWVNGPKRVIRESK